MRETLQQIAEFHNGSIKDAEAGREASGPGGGTMIAMGGMPVLRTICARVAKGFARWRSESGNVLVEFAFTMPVLFTALIGACSYSLWYYGMQQLSNAGSTAIQAVADKRGITTDPCAAAVTAVTTSLPNWSAAKFTYTLTITDGTNTGHTYGPTTGSTFSCTGGETYQTANYPVALTLKYAYTWVPIMGMNPAIPLYATEGTMSY